MSQLTAFFDNL